MGTYSPVPVVHSGWVCDTLCCRSPLPWSCRSLVIRIWQYFYYFAPNTGAKYCDERVCMFVCLSVCLSAHMSQKPHVLTSQNFLYMLTIAVARGPPPLTIMQYVMYFRFCRWRHVAHNRPGKGDANKAYTQWLTRVSTGEVWYLLLPYYS